MAAPAQGTPSGTVTFFDASTALGTVPLSGSGVATLTTTSLVLGTHPICQHEFPSLLGGCRWVENKAGALVLLLKDRPERRLVGDESIRGHIRENCH